jgi:probable HAF family extracellular repeat protein
MGDNNTRAILWTTPTQWQDLGTLGGAESQALAINDQGMITGWADSAAARTAFLYRDGVMQAVAGLETTTSRGNAINASGDIAGYVGYDGSYDRQAFVHIDGQTIVLDNPLGLASEAQDINDAGWVVGTLYGSTTPSAAAGGFLYVDGQMIDVSTLLDPASGWLVRQANDINDRNQIWAEVCRGTDCQWALLTPVPVPVPEPAHWSMLALGLPPVAALARRRRAARAS